MILIAHRAGPESYPEQTIAAARDSLEKGAELVEIDVRYTADGVAVICHDENAERVFGVNKKIEELTSAEFLSFHHKENPEYTSHSLEDFLREGILKILIHNKAKESCVPKTLALLQKYHCGDRAVMGVSSLADAELVKKISLATQVLSFAGQADLTEAFIGAGADIVRLWENWVTEEHLERIHARGRQVWIMAGTPATVGYTDSGNLIKWKAWGADGVLVNEIGNASEVLKAALAK